MKAEVIVEQDEERLKFLEENSISSAVDSKLFGEIFNIFNDNTKNIVNEQVGIKSGFFYMTGGHEKNIKNRYDKVLQHYFKRYTRYTGCVLDRHKKAAILTYVVLKEQIISIEKDDIEKGLHAGLIKNDVRDKTFFLSPNTILATLLSLQVIQTECLLIENRKRLNENKNFDNYLEHWYQLLIQEEIELISEKKEIAHFPFQHYAHLYYRWEIDLFLED